jgi:hypothetical protein
MATELEALLIDLRAAQDQQNLVLRSKDQARADAIPTEVARALADIDVEFAPMVLGVTERATEAEAKVRSFVLVNMTSGKAAGLEALYCEGRTTWDTKGLDKAVKLIPGLADYRKQGEPYVILRKAKDEA